MLEVDEATIKCYNELGVSQDIPIFLFDNAGEGCMEQKRTRTNVLKSSKINMVCVHQHPCSPVTNILDLGVRMDGFVKHGWKLYYNKRLKLNVLCKIVAKVWDELSKAKLRNVYKRWKLGFDLIIKYHGQDWYVESNWGKLFQTSSLEAEYLNKEKKPQEVEEKELLEKEINGCDQLISYFIYSTLCTWAWT